MTGLGHIYATVGSPLTSSDIRQIPLRDSLTHIKLALIKHVRVKHILTKHSCRPTDQY